MTIAKRTVLGLIVFGAVFIFCSLNDGFSAEDKKEDKKPAVVETEITLDEMVFQKQDVTIDEHKLIQLSQSLKNAIDENKELKKDRERVLEEIKQLRGEHEVDSNRLNALTQEQDELKRRADAARENMLKASEEQERKIQELLAASEQKIQELKTASEQKSRELQTAFEQKNQELQTAADQKTRELEAKLKKVEEELVQEKKWNEEIESLKPPPQNEAPFLPGTPAAQKQGLQKMLSRIQQLAQENDRLKSESAKVHYNLGNVFFKQGEYKRAVDEYAQALKWMPYDAANHYNLAFVSGEFLNDSKTALKHYQQYLFLNPGAKDAAFVKEKILKARMELKAAIDSPLDAKTKIDDSF